MPRQGGVGLIRAQWTAMAHPTFVLAEATTLLDRTPPLLDAWLRPLPSCWLACDEGPQTWNATVVVGHLIEGELTDWLPRTRHILAHGDGVPFLPFDRFTQLRRPERTIDELLDEFARLRRQSLADLRALDLQPGDLERRGRHPEFGPVTLGQHLATWVAHDLTHIAQIARVLAHRHADAVGPWRQYLRIVQPR